MYSIKTRDKTLWKNTLKIFLDQPNLLNYAIELIWTTGSFDHDVDIMIDLLTKKKIDPDSIKRFMYGGWFNNISLDVFKKFLYSYANITDNKFSHNMIPSIYFYIDKKNESFNELNDIILKYALNEHIYKLSDTSLAYYWFKIIDEYFIQGKDNLNILSQIIENLDKPLFDQNDNYVIDLINKSLNQDIENTWDILSNTLLKNNKNAFLLSYMLKGDISISKSSEKPIINQIPQKYLLKWCSDHPKKAPYILSKIIPINTHIPDLHPIAVQLLLKYPENDEIKSGLSANWYSEGFMGPASEHYKKKLAIANHWKEKYEGPIKKWVEGEIRLFKDLIKKYQTREEEENFPY